MESILSSVAKDVCIVDGCLKRCKSRGLCSGHYERRRLGKDVGFELSSKRRRTIEAGCSYPGCTHEPEARGLCHAHWQQRFTYNIPLRPVSPDVDPTATPRTCHITGCTNVASTGMWLCGKHWKRAWKYGLSTLQLDMILRVTHCAICHSGFTNEKSRHIDHDHECCNQHPHCGQCIRGVICAGCNTGIGLFRNSPALLGDAAAYLRGHQLAA